jgi:hypothetical protein
MAQEEDKPFWNLVLDKWVWLVTSSILASAWWAWSLFSSDPLPFWGGCVLIGAGFLMAVYLAGRHTHAERKKLAERLEPKLEIRRVGPHSHDHRRITVHNKTSKTIRFRARLYESKPGLKDYTLPVDLQPTHCKDSDTLGEIGPNDDQPVDVLVDYGHPNILAIKLMGSPPWNLDIPRDERRELLIGVYPIDDDGEGERRWFYIVPERDGSVVFTADGSFKEHKGSIASS